MRIIRIRTIQQHHRIIFRMVHQPQHPVRTHL